MTDTRFIAILSALQTIPAAIAACFAAYFSYRSSALSRATLEVSKEVRLNTDGMSDKLVALTAKASLAEGLLEGRAEAVVLKPIDRPAKP